MKRTENTATAGHALFPTLAQMSQQFLGATLLLLGLALVSTLWLLPIGLPMMLVGVALIAT
jgi:hypothetical protein